MTTPACPSCSHQPFGPFCQACGERQVVPTDYSLRHFAGEAAEAVASPDSRTLRTLRSLILKPGFLTAEYFAGRRVRYMRPLQLFLLCNLAFFLLQPQLRGLNVFTTTLHDQLESMPYSAIARRMVYARAPADTEEFRIFERRFNALTHDHARALVIAMTPLFALVLAALYVRSRHYYTQHLVFSMHFYSFFILLILGTWFNVLALLRLGHAAGISHDRMAWMGTDATYSLVVLAACVVYLVTAMQRAYGGARSRTLVRGVVASLSLFFVLSAYRLILLFTVLTFM